MSTNSANSQLVAFKTRYSNLNHWLAELDNDAQLKVLKSLATSPVMRNSYPDFCAVIDSTASFTRNLFDALDDSLESVEADLNDIFGGMIPEVIREVLDASAVEEDNNLDSLASPTHAATLDDIAAPQPVAVIHYIFTAGNNSLEIAAATRDEFCDKISAHVAELKRNGYPEDLLPQSFRHLTDSYIRIVAGGIFDAQTQQTTGGVAEVREYAAKKSTGGSNK